MTAEDAAALRAAVGGRIHDARGAMTQLDLAGKCGVHRSTVSMWETGSREIRLPHLLAVARATGESVTWLLTGERVISGPDLVVVVAAADVLAEVAGRVTAAA